MSTLRVFTPRSTGIGIAVGVLVAGGFGHPFNAAWGLALLNGFAAGALALAISICTRDGRFAFLIEKAHQRRPGFGVRMLAIAVIALPMFFVGDIVEIELFNRIPLTLLLGGTAWAEYLLGGIMTLAYLDDGDAATDPGRYREAPPPGERGPTPPLRVFTARSAGIGIATGMLVAIALEQFLGTAWGLASLNGLAAGALVLAVSSGVLGDSWFFDTKGGGWLFATKDNQQRIGLWTLAYAIMIAPPVCVGDYVEFGPANEVAVELLFLLTGFASYTSGCVVATLVYLDGDTAAADPRLQRVTTPPGERRGS